MCGSGGSGFRLSGLPDVHVRVSAYQAWIESVTGPVSSSGLSVLPVAYIVYVRVEACWSGLERVYVRVSPY